MTVPPATAPCPKVRMRMPLLWRHSLLLGDGAGGLLTLDLLWTTPAQWRRGPERRDPGWIPLPLGYFILAVRVGR